MYSAIFSTSLPLHSQPPMQDIPLHPGADTQLNAILHELCVIVLYFCKIRICSTICPRKVIHGMARWTHLLENPSPQGAAQAVWRTRRAGLSHLSAPPSIFAPQEVIITYATQFSGSFPQRHGAYTHESQIVNISVSVIVSPLRPHSTSSGAGGEAAKPHCCRYRCCCCTWRSLHSICH